MDINQQLGRKRILHNTALSHNIYNDRHRNPYLSSPPLGIVSTIPGFFNNFKYFFKDDILGNINTLSHNICNGRHRNPHLSFTPPGVIYKMSHNMQNDRPNNPLFLLTPLVFVLLIKALGYASLTFIALASIYYTFHFACLIDDACFALNYEVKL